MSSLNRGLLIRFVFYLVRAEIICAFFPYSIVKKLAFGKKKLRQSRTDNPNKILGRNFNFLLIVSRNLPWHPTCLRQAIALRDSLAYDGIESVIKIGVLQKDGKKFIHAWLECLGIVLLKNDNYNELTSFSGGNNDAPA